MKIFIYESLVTNPYYNLAIEDYLCHYVSSEAVYGKKICGIFIWQSDNAVVIGKNQNPLYECNMDVLQRHNVKLVRRLTGGGAVYHDLGNLNYSFISSETEASIERNIEIVINTLKRIGIETISSGRNDIVTKKYEKISGTAKKKYEHALLHHGTLLISLNKEMAERCLTPSRFKLSNKGVKSVKSRMVNINELVEGTSVSDVKEYIKKEFEVAYGNSEIFMPCFSDSYINKIYELFISHEWIMGENFNNFWIIQKEWGTIRFSITERKECIHSIKYETDSIEVDFIAEFFSGLRDVKLTRQSLLEYLETLNKQKIYNEQCICIATDVIEKIIYELQGETNESI